MVVDGKELTMDEVKEVFKQQTIEANEQRENLEKIKLLYPNLELLPHDINNEIIDIESMNITQGFKRCSFVFFEEYKVSKPSFYGNITCSCDKPKSVSALALLTIWSLMDLGYDRYTIIMKIVGIIQGCQSTPELINEFYHLNKQNRK